MWVNHHFEIFEDFIKECLIFDYVEDFIKECLIFDYAPTMSLRGPALQALRHERVARV